MWPVWLRSINRLIWWKLCSSNVVDLHCCFSGAGSCFAATVNRVQCDQMMLKYKIVQNVSKSYPRSSHSSFYTRERFFKKVLIVGASFVSTFVAKNFQKYPTLGTLIGFNKYVELMIMSDSNSFLPARLRTANFLSNVMLSAGTLIRRLLLRCSSHRARSRP